jgi:hypothetical protein
LVVGAGILTVSRFLPNRAAWLASPKTTKHVKPVFCRQPAMYLQCFTAVDYVLLDVIGGKDPSYFNQVDRVILCNLAQYLGV